MDKMINGFDNELIEIKLNMLVNYGEDSQMCLIKKTVKDINLEIIRVKNLDYYKGEDDCYIKQIEEYIIQQKRNYIQKLKGFFILIVYLKLYILRFKSRNKSQVNNYRTPKDVLNNWLGVNMKQLLKLI